MADDETAQVATGDPGGTKVSRRALLRSTSLGAFGALAAGCLGGSSGDSNTLTWWPGWPGSYMKGVGKAFEKANRGLTLKIGNFYPDPEKLLSSLAAGNAPDVVADLPYYNFLARGLALPLDTMIQGSHDISLTDGDIRDSNWNAFVWKGKHYGIPYADTAGRGAMAYNLDLVEKAGLDPEALPTTWDEVFDWHKKITTFDKAGNLQILGMDPMAERAGATSDGDPWLWPEMWGFHYFNQERLTYDIDRPETVDFLETILRFYDHVGVTKMSGLSSSMENRPLGAIGQGRQAMGITYPAGPASVFNADPKDRFTFGWVPMPAEQEGKRLQTAAGHASIIMRSSKNPKTAFKLAVYLTQKEVCDLLFENVGWLGPRKSWQQTVDLNKYPEDVQKNILFFTQSLDQADDLWVVDKDPLDGYLSDQWTQAISRMTNHSLTPQAAATFLQTKMTEDMKTERGKFH